ncbi:hypothetical protein BHM03_00062434 [Ensete ventricosum]|nr:hypothetical protein BHM03_00062434 [Ensete ventricosum]
MERLHRPSLELLIVNVLGTGMQSDMNSTPAILSYKLDSSMIHVSVSPRSRGRRGRRGRGRKRRGKRFPARLSDDGPL